jgi:hypothetical protein
LESDRKRKKRSEEDDGVARSGWGSGRQEHSQDRVDNEGRDDVSVLDGEENAIARRMFDRDFRGRWGSRGGGRGGREGEAWILPYRTEKLDFPPAFSSTLALFSRWTHMSRHAIIP